MQSSDKDNLLVQKATGTYKRQVERHDFMQKATKGLTKGKLSRQNIFHAKGKDDL